MGLTTLQDSFWGLEFRFKVQGVGLMVEDCL